MRVTLKASTFCNSRRHFARTPTYLVVLVRGDGYKDGLWHNDLKRFVFFSWQDLKLQYVLVHGVQENLQ